MKILLIVQPERFDFYRYLNAIPNVEWFLLWYEKPGQMKVSKETLPVRFEHVYYWTQFATPTALLKKIRPDRIIFFEIIDLRQIALNVTASANKIPTFYVEHGAAGDRETAVIRWNETSFKKNKLPYLIKRFKTSFLDVLRAKIFYYSVFTGFKSIRSFTTYLLLPFKMLKTAPNKVLANNIFRERVPWKSIVFNETNFEEFSLYTGIGKEDAIFSGVPFFDSYYRERQEAKDYIVYIDHPYLEEKILGWTEEHHQFIAESLFRFAEERQVKLYIKLHPRSRPELWKQYRCDDRYVHIIQAGDFTELYLEAKLILGFSSSLINGFLCAKKNVVLLGWHPVPHIFGADFSKSGLCHVSYSVKDLAEKYEHWLNHNLLIENDALYKNFLNRFNEPFDGKATQRVLQAITTYEIS